MWEHFFLILLMFFSTCHLEKYVTSHNSVDLFIICGKILIIIFFFQKKSIYQITKDCAVCRFWMIL